MKNPTKYIKSFFNTEDTVSKEEPILGVKGITIDPFMWTFTCVKTQGGEAVLLVKRTK